MAAKMGGFRSPNGMRKPVPPGIPSGNNLSGMPSAGYKKGGIAKKMVGGSRKKK